LIIGVAVAVGFALLVVIVLAFVLLHGKKKTTAIVSLPEAPEGEVLSPKKSSRRDRESQNMSLSSIPRSNSFVNPAPPSVEQTRPKVAERKPEESLEGYEVS